MITHATMAGMLNILRYTKFVRCAHLQGCVQRMPQRDAQATKCTQAGYFSKIVDNTPSQYPRILHANVLRKEQSGIIPA